MEKPKSFFRGTSILKQARHANNMTQQQAADAAKIHLRQYQRFESGERDIATASFCVVMTICKALNIAPENLL